MLGNVIRVISIALFLDGILLATTLPLTKLAVGFMLPPTIPVAPLLGTYSLVVFVSLAVILLSVLWIFERWYIRWFDFWDLLVTMIILMLIIVFGKHMLQIGGQLGLQTSF